MKKYLSILFLLLMGWSCRPQEDLTITDSSIFDYNFQIFITGKNNDTLNVNQWYQYEVYLKPFSTNKLLNHQRKIVLSPVISVGKLGSYQILNLRGDSLTSVQRFGDVVQLSSDSLINNRFIIKEKFDNPNVQGSINQTTTIQWNSINKVFSNNIYVK
jgi:hypothetical protein